MPNCFQLGIFFGAPSMGALLRVQVLPQVDQDERSPTAWGRPSAGWTRGAQIDVKGHASDAGATRAGGVAWGEDLLGLTNDCYRRSKTVEIWRQKMVAKLCQAAPQRTDYCVLWWTGLPRRSDLIRSKRPVRTRTLGVVWQGCSR